MSWGEAPTAFVACSENFEPTARCAVGTPAPRTFAAPLVLLSDVSFTPLVDHLASPIGLKASLALVHFVWQGVLIAALAAVLMRLIARRSPRRRYAIGVAGIVLMAAAPVVTFCLVTPPPPVPPLAVEAAVAELPQDDLLLEIDQLDALLATMEAELGPLPEIEPPALDRPLTWPERLQLWQPYGLALWLVGSGLFGLRLLVGLHATWRFGRSRRPLPAEWIATAAKVANRLGVKAPRIFVSDRIVEAVAVGFLKPMVLVPTSWIGNVPLDVLEAVLAHELVHLRRYDLWVNLLQRCVETVLFYHPAVWWLSRRVRIEREYCCDETAATAITGRAAYARALEFVATERVAATRPTRYGTALAAGLGGNRMALLDRVRRVLGADGKPPRGSWLSEGLLALAVPLALWAGIATIGPAMAQADEREKKDGHSQEHKEEPKANDSFTKSDFERLTGRSLADEDVTVAVVCYAPTELKWDHPEVDREIAEFVSHRLQEYEITVRRPEQVRAWIDANPNWDIPEEVSAGVGASHAIFIDLSKFGIYLLDESPRYQGKAEAVVSVVESQPDGDAETVYKRELRSVYPLTVPQHPSERTFKAFKQRYIEHIERLSDEISRLFYKGAEGDRLISNSQDDRDLQEGAREHEVEAGRDLVLRDGKIMNLATGEVVQDEVLVAEEPRHRLAGDDRSGTRDAVKGHFWEVPKDALIERPSSPTLERTLRELREEVKTLRKELDDLQRRKRAEAQPNPRVEAALEKPISLSLKDVSLREVVDQLRDQTKIDFVIDTRGLDEEGVTLETPVSIELNDVSLRSALQLILTPLNLGYVTSNEVVEITSRQRTKGPLEVRTYPVADLLGKNPKIPRWDKKGPQPDGVQPPTFDSLIELISGTVNPGSWEMVGGNGVIRKNETTQSLVVRQTKDAHEEIEDLLETLRKSPDKKDASEFATALKREYEMTIKARDEALQAWREAVKSGAAGPEREADLRDRYFQLRQHQERLLEEFAKRGLEGPAPRHFSRRPAQASDEDSTWIDLFGDGRKYRVRMHRDSPKLDRDRPEAPERPSAPAKPLAPAAPDASAPPLPMSGDPAKATSISRVVTLEIDGKQVPVVIEEVRDPETKGPAEDIRIRVLPKAPKGAKVFSDPAEGERALEAERLRLQLAVQQHKIEQLQQEIQKPKVNRSSEEALQPLVEQYNDLIRARAYLEAILVAEKAKEIAPDDPAPVMMLYKAKFLEHGRRIVADRVLEHDAEWQKLIDEWMQELGKASFDRKKENEAIQPLIEKYNQLIEDRSYQEAILIAKEAREIAPEHPVTIPMLYRAKVLYEQGRNRAQ